MATVACRPNPQTRLVSGRTGREQEMPALVVSRRTEQGFVREVYEGTDAVLPLPEIETELPLAEIYEGVEFTPEEGDR